MRVKVQIRRGEKLASYEHWDAGVAAVQGATQRHWQALSNWNDHRALSRRQLEELTGFKTPPPQRNNHIFEDPEDLSMLP